MRGSLLLEREHDWDKALRNFENARDVYEELGKYGDVENKVLCQQRVEELDPSIRYCKHRMGDVIQRSDLLDLSNQDGRELDPLAYALFKRSEQRGDSTSKKLSFDEVLIQEDEQLRERSRGEVSSYMLGQWLMTRRPTNHYRREWPQCS